jgi:hypothetical protein
LRALSESDNPLVAEANRGFALRDSGRGSEALYVWDRLLADGQSSDEDEDLVLVGVRHAKAHLLFGLGRLEDASVAAADAVHAAQLIPGIDAEIIAAQAMGVQRSVLTDLGQLDAALDIDRRLADRYGERDNFELRLCAARAMQHEIWGRLSQRDQTRAIACARRLVEILGGDQDPGHLIEIGELILSISEQLDHRSMWRRHPAALRDQARAMRDTVLNTADTVGGDIGAAVALNARLGLSNANLRDRRLVTFLKEGRDRPSIQQSALPALQQVEETARAAGSQARYLDLVMSRATALDEAGRTDEARQVLDDTIASLDTAGAKGDALLARAMKRLFES